VEIEVDVLISRGYKSQLIPHEVSVNGRTRLSTQDAENSTHLMSHKSPQHHATFIKMEAAGKNFLYRTRNFNCHVLTDDLPIWHDWFARHDWNEMKMLDFYFFFKNGRWFFVFSPRTKIKWRAISCGLWWRLKLWKLKPQKWNAITKAKRDNVDTKRVSFSCWFDLILSCDRQINLKCYFLVKLSIKMSFFNNPALIFKDRYANLCSAVKVYSNNAMRNWVHLRVTESH
jgi:hypothetical protein